MSAGQAVLGFALVAAGVIGTLATVLGFFGSAWWLFDWIGIEGEAAFMPSSWMTLDHRSAPCPK